MAAGPPDRGLRELGRVTAQFAYLEHVLASLVWGLLRIPQRAGQVVTAQLSFQRLLDVVGALARERGLPTEELDRRLAAAAAAGMKRDTLVHSTWFTEVDGELVSRLKITARRTGRRVQWADVDVKDIEAVADELASAADDLVMLGDQLGLTSQNLDAT